jgi:hypothetical protein
MANLNMAAPMEKAARRAVEVATDYARTTPIHNSNTIPHHSMVESVEEGEKNGRHYFTRPTTPA